MLKGHKSYASAAELLCVVLLGALLTRLVPIPGIPKDDSILSVVSRVIASNEVLTYAWGSLVGVFAFAVYYLFVQAQTDKRTKRKKA